MTGRMRRVGFIATLAAGVGLLGASLHGMTNVDHTLKVAAATPAPASSRTARVRERPAERDCDRGASASSAATPRCSVRACAARTWSAAFRPTGPEASDATRHWSRSATACARCPTVRPASATTGSSTSSKACGRIRTSSCVTHGDWSDYDRVRCSRFGAGTRCDGSRLDFGHVREFERSFPLFLEALARRPPDLTFQVGIPGDLDMALFVLGPRGALRAPQAVHGRDRRRDRGDPRARRRRRDLPGRDPGRARRGGARCRGRCSRRWRRCSRAACANLARRSPEGARFGVHLCLGDMNHRALGAAERHRAAGDARQRAGARVAATTGRWSSSTRRSPPPSSPPPRGARAGTRRSTRLRLKPGTRLIAGVAHEDQVARATSASCAS